jgi:hypothetical protein
VNIKTTCIYPPIPIRDFDWCAYDDDTYDGAPDSRNRSQIGYGKTEADAVLDLLDLIGD